MSTNLKDTFGFSSGNINTGNSGEGWGINTSTFFSLVGKTYFVSPQNGIIIDLNDLVYMNPIEKVDFLADASNFNQKYIKIIQEDNLVYVIPNAKKIQDDNYPNDIFLLPIFVTYNGRDDIVNVLIDLNSSNQPTEKYDLTYGDMFYKIPLNTLVKNSTMYTDLELMDNFNITYINGIQPEILNVNSNILHDGYLDTNYIKDIFNPKIDYSYMINGNTGTGQIFFTNHLINSKQDILIHDIVVEISPINGALFDIKEYATGNTENLVILSCDQISRNTNSFNLEFVEHFISIVPNTYEMFKLEVPEIFKYKLAYSTPTSRGIFNIDIIVDPTIIENIPETLNGLLPIVSNKNFILSDGYFTNGKYLNIESMLGNRVFDPLNKPRVSLLLNNDLNININNIETPNIFSTKNEKIIKESVNIKFEFSPIGTTPLNYSAKIDFSDDKILYKENFEVNEMTFEVSPDYKNNLNLFDYIIVNSDQYKNLTFEIISESGEVFDYATDPIQLISVRDNFIKPFLDETISTNIPIELISKIKVKLPTYKNMDTKDDYDRIIGYREIPYTIKVSPTPVDNDFVRLEDIKIYLDKLLMLDINNKTSGILHYVKDTSKITEVRIHPDTNIEVDHITTPDQLNSVFTHITVNSTNNDLSIQWSPLLSPLVQNTKIVLEIDYTDKNTQVSTQLQTIYFLNKGI